MFLSILKILINIIMFLNSPCFKLYLLQKVNMESLNSSHIFGTKS